MILQIRPNARKIHHDLHARLLQQLLWPNPAPLQHLWTMNRPSRNNNLLPSLHPDLLLALPILGGHGTTLAYHDRLGALVVVKEHLVDAVPRQDLQVGPLGGGVPVAVDRVGAGRGGVVEGGWVPDYAVGVALFASVRGFT